MSLVILASILLFLQPFLQTIPRLESYIKKSDYLEVQMGKIQIEMEVREATYQKIENNKLIYTHPEEGLVIFEKYKQMIRKTSDRNGHQPIMTGVKEVFITEKNELISLEVITLEEESYHYFLFP